MTKDRPEKVEDDQVLVVPVHLDVVVGAHLLQVAHRLLDRKKIEIAGNFQHRDVAVGECSPAAKVSAEQVLAHVDAPLEHLLVRRHVGLEDDPHWKFAESDEVLGHVVRLEALVPGEVLLFAKKLPELQRKFISDKMDRLIKSFGIISRIQLCVKSEGGRIRLSVNKRKRIDS